MGTPFDMARVLTRAREIEAEWDARDRQRDAAKRQQVMDQAKFTSGLEGERFDRFGKLYGEYGVPAKQAGAMTGYPATGLPDVAPSFAQKQQEWSAKTTLSPADEDKQATDLLQHLLDKNHPYDQALELTGSAFPGWKSRRNIDPAHFKGYGPPPKPKLTLDKLLSLREQAKAHYLSQRYSGPEAAQMAEDDLPMSLLDTGDAVPPVSALPPSLPMGNRDTEAGPPVHPVISALLRAAQSAKANASHSIPSSPSGPPQMEPNAILDDKIGQWNKLNAEYRTTTDPVRKAQLSRGMDDLSLRINQIKSGQPLHPTTPMGETERRRIEDQARYQQGQLQNAADRNAETGRKNRVDELQHARRLDMEQSRAEAQTAQGWTRLNEDQRHHLADEWTRKYGIDQRVFQGTMKTKSGEGLKPGERATLMRLPLEDWLSADHRSLLKKWDAEDKADTQTAASPVALDAAKKAAQDRINLRSTWRTNLLRIGEKKRNAVINGYQQQRGAAPLSGLSNDPSVNVRANLDRSYGPGTFDRVDQIMRNAGISTFAWTHNANRESGGNPNAVGDGGTSFGLFQLHKGGLLGSLTPQQARDPITAAKVVAAEAVRQGVDKIQDPTQQALAFTQKVERPAARVQAQVRRELSGRGPSDTLMKEAFPSSSTPKRTPVTTSRPGGPRTPLTHKSKTGSAPPRRKANPGVNDYLSGVLR
jgi:hypothetical protein